MSQASRVRQDVVVTTEMTKPSSTLRNSPFRKTSLLYSGILRREKDLFDTKLFLS